MFFVLLRVLIGGVLLASGLQKALGPYQNFLYIVQAYEMLPSFAEKIVALSLPWIELAVGALLVLGMWTKPMLQAALLMFAMFIVVVGQALLRGLPLEQCGCFGAAIHIAPHVIIVIDSITVILIYVLLRNLPKTTALSLDRLFSK